MNDAATDYYRTAESSSDSVMVQSKNVKGV